MATTSITFCEHAGTISAMKIGGSVTEVKTPSGSNQQTTAVATTKLCLVRVATDTAIYVSFGTNPNATSDAGRFMLPAGGVEYYGATPGDEVAVATV